MRTDRSCKFPANTWINSQTFVINSSACSYSTRLTPRETEMIVTRVPVVPILASAYYLILCLQHHTTFSESDPLAISKRGSPLYLTSTSHPSSLPISKAPSPKTYPLKRSMAKRFSRHNGEVTTGYPVASSKFLLIHSHWRWDSLYYDFGVGLLVVRGWRYFTQPQGVAPLERVTKLSTLMPEVWLIPCQRIVGEGQRPVV